MYSAPKIILFPAALLGLATLAMGAIPGGFDEYTLAGVDSGHDVIPIQGTPCFRRLNAVGRTTRILVPPGLAFNDCRPPTSSTGMHHLPGIGESFNLGPSSNSLLRTWTGDFGTFNGGGEVRITCGTSHMAYDDPIVAPGQDGASHLHTFFGNAGTDHNSTYQSLRNEPLGSTCAGGSANKSAYWFPSLIDDALNEAVVPTQVYVYYKTGYWGQDGRNVVPMPDGLRMVSGDAAAAQSQTTWIAGWSCTTNGGSGVAGQTIRSSSSIPVCEPGNLLVATVLMPQCWNGVDLDSPDHMAHMAHPNFQGECPATHPVLLPQITIHATWDMGPDGSTDLYLSNDMMTPAGALPGQGLHADFFEAWDPDLRDDFVENCLNGQRDCGVRSLGDGYSLLDP